MSHQQELIIISKYNIGEKNQEYLIHDSYHQCISKITCQSIREKSKSVWKEAKYSLPETYIFFGQYPNAFLYGLYKSENNKIYIVKSFMDTVINVIPFNKKYFE